MSTPGGRSFFKTNRLNHGYLFQVITVTFQAAGKLWVRGWRPLGITVRVMAGETLPVFADALVNFRKPMNGRAMQSQVMGVGTTAKNSYDG